LTTKPCDAAENNLKIIDNQPVNGTKKRYGVCTKQTILESREYTPKFVEWVELLRILGAAKIHIVVKYVHPDMKKVLNYYEEKDIIEVIPFLEPSGISTSKMHSRQDWMLQMNTLNDCFYRVRNLYEILVIIDPDEVIVPVLESDRTWNEMLKHVNLTEKRCSYQAQNVYYPETGAKLFPEIPKHNYMLQHVQRSVNYSKTGHSVKSFFLPEKIIVVHNHNALYSWYDYLKPSWIGNFPTNISQMSHYRDSVDKAFNQTTVDLTLWKFADKLIRAVSGTLREVQFEDEIIEG
jgi:Glycosyltransferase family 92